MSREVPHLDLDHAEILIDDSVRDALIAMGWTPPCPGCGAEGDRTTKDA